MFEKLLGLIDLLSAIAIVLLAFGAGKEFAVIMIILLIIKSLIFITAFASWVDLGCGVVMVICIFYGVGIAGWIAFIWLVQKSFISMFSG